MSESRAACDHTLGLVLNDEYRGLVKWSEMADVPRTFREAAVVIGEKYTQYLAMSDDDIVACEVSFFRFCPRCGAALEIPESWRSPQHFEDPSAPVEWHVDALSMIPPDLMEQALIVFGTRDQVVDWMAREQMALGWKIPLILAKTEEGRRQVMDLLVRMEYGTYT